MSLESALKAFAKAAKFRGKGPLCVALVMTQKARGGLPLNEDKLLTPGGGQVEGLGKAAVQAVLERHSITRILAQEGGRTSRGSVGNTRAYVKFLNSLPQPVALDNVEAFWIERVKEYFAGKPFKFKADPSLSVRALVRELLVQAQDRQKDMPGSTYEGTLLQHLVGAKLDIILGAGKVEHHSASEADEAEGRGGDFVVGDVAVHVTTSPGESLVEKCSKNIASGFRPLIITSGKGAAVAEGLTEQACIGDRVDVLDAEQFFAANLYEWGKFNAKSRGVATKELLTRYNELIDKFETDPSLKVEMQ